LQQRTVDFNLSQDGMVQLAEETGGLAFTNTNEISALVSPFAAQDVPLQLTPLFPRDGADKPMLRGLVGVYRCGALDATGR
jgi:hypothetical protein